MQIFLMGHRGTGKTSLLQRYQIYGRGGFPVFDLDREIEKQTGQTVSQIFNEKGEAAFRELEQATAQKLIDSHPKMVCALGAGFPLNEFVFPSTSELVWVRRTSDARGRIFLNRPRLDADLPPLEEFRRRFHERDQVYARHADWIYLLPEGLTSPCEFERKILGERLADIGGTLTLRPDHFRNPRVFRDRIAKMGVDFFELRNDYLNLAELQMAYKYLPEEKILIAIRELPVTEPWQEALDRAVLIDWPIELGEVHEARANVISLHETRPDESLARAVGRLLPFEEKGQHVKWSPEIQDFDEIDFGLRWQEAKPDQRSFLPRSQEGRWNWVRLFLKDRQKINFFRDGDGSAGDQPTLHEWTRSLSRASGFAAVLGHPVNHSFSPIEHLHYAHLRQMSFFAVDLREEEWDQAWAVLKNWGLKFAAVTSPLKRKAAEASQQKSPELLQLHSANTLTRLAGEEFRGHNTDLHGFAEMIDGIEGLGAVVVWGGGGTLPVIQKVLPEAQAYSIRTRQPRDQGVDSIPSPQTVVWAGSPEAEPPGPFWKPRWILDLNYREDSRAQEYAQKTGARYVSGLLMFKAQAQAQREEWESHGQ